MSLKTAARGTIPPFIVMDVLRVANERHAAGGAVFHLEVGQPGTGAPAPVVEAVRKAVGTGRLGYTDAMGIPPLRRRIARHYAERYGVEVAPTRVAVTTGSSGAFLLSFLAAFDAGDRVGVPTPGYPAYRNILRALGVEVVEVRTHLEEGFRLTPELLEVVDGPLDGLILASPANPTGTVLSRDDLSSIVHACATAGIRLVSDEIYHDITYGLSAPSALELTSDAIVINSFSKYYSMTGWRLGWMVLPEELVRPVECLAQNLFISPPTLSQVAAVHAFDASEELDGHVARYARNRARILEALPQMGIERWGPSDGAFYLYADISRFSRDSESFCRRMLEESGVATTPGTDFDPEQGNLFLRISFAGAEEDISRAMDAMGGWLKGIPGVSSPAGSRRPGSSERWRIP
jgi:aspartate/methionine/tyrosine aminotransferase